MIADDSNLANFTASDIDNPDHVGRRIEHLTDLYELYQIGLDILNRFDKDSSSYTERKRELEAAIKLLRFRVERNYSENYYRNSVDLLGRPEDIK